MIKYDQDYIKYNEILKSIEYFDSFSETFLFETYRETLIIDNELPFPEGFSIQDKDLFYRLKFRALNSNRTHINLDPNLPKIN